MVFDTYRNMDVKSNEFCTVLFGRMMSQADRRFLVKINQFPSSLVVGGGKGSGSSSIIVHAK